MRKDFLGMLKSQIWRKSYFREFLFANLLHTVYMLIFRFDTSPKKLLVSCDYHVLFVIWLAMVCKVNDVKIFYCSVRLDIQIIYI